MYVKNVTRSCLPLFRSLKLIKQSGSAFRSQSPIVSAVGTWTRSSVALNSHNSPTGKSKINVQTKFLLRGLCNHSVQIRFKFYALTSEYRIYHINSNNEVKLYLTVSLSVTPGMLNILPWDSISTIKDFFLCKPLK